jgi:hypothetical protein
MMRFLFVLICLSLPPALAQAADVEAVLIASGESNGPKQPQATMATDGSIHVVYGAGDEVYYCCSRDQGKSFSKPSVAFRVPNMSLGMRRGPRIVAFGESIVVTAIGGKQGKGRDGDILAWRSIDRGESWQGPNQVNDVQDSAREGLHAMTLSSTGHAWCTWLDLRNQRTELFASKSSDGGATWSPNQLVYRCPEKNICECCQPSIAIHDQSVHILFRNSIEGNRDMYLVSRDFDKATLESQSSAWTSHLLGKEHWKFNACPMDGGMLAIDAKGAVTTVWRRGRDIFTAADDESDENLVGTGEQPWIASTKEGMVIVWSLRRDGQLSIQNISKGHTHTVAATARDPVVVADPLHGKTAFVLWEQVENGRSSIYAKGVELASLESAN